MTSKAENEAMAKVSVSWGKPALIHDLPEFKDKGLDARLIHPGKFGSEYARLLYLPDNSWLVVYTVYDNNGYTLAANGGTALQFSRSLDGGKTWTIVSTLYHPSRDLDNGQMILDGSGAILLACRSVRWQESYQLPVYRSCDNGKSWAFLSMIDEANAAPGCLGNPDKGMYEPHFYRLHDGKLSVMYANEKHVTRPPYYSQIISQKVSPDDGRTWGEEIFVACDAAQPQLRPGMPVWTRMRDGAYIVVFEVVSLMLTQLASADIYYKISDDGVRWEPGIGKRIPDQWGGPYILQMPGGQLIVTSNSGKISVSSDGAQRWGSIEQLPFGTHLWPSLYALGRNRFLLLNALKRSQGGNNVQMCIGEFV